MTKFFDSINKIVGGGDPLSGRAEAVAKLNPDKIYVENVRSALGVSTPRAQQICETAVRQGLFDQYVEVVCPDDAVAASAHTESELPDKVRCWIDRDGEIEEMEIPTNTLTKRTFYRFVR